MNQIPRPKSEDEPIAVDTYMQENHYIDEASVESLDEFYDGDDEESEEDIWGDGFWKEGNENLNSKPKVIFSAQDISSPKQQAA